MLYKIIENGDIVIQVDRYVSFFTQGVAYSAMKIGLPLSTMAKAYSLSFVVFQFLIFLFILKILKNKWMALGLLLFNILMVRHTFYWTASELIQGMAVVFLFVAAIQNSLHVDGRLKFLYHALAIFSLITVAFAHPLLNIPLVYACAFIFLKYPDSKSRITAIAYGLCIVAFYFFKQQYFSNYYDNNAMKGLDNFAKFFPNYNTPSMEKFLGWLYKDYYFFLAGALLVPFYYLKRKKILRPLLMVLFCIGYSLLVNVSFPKDAYQFYLESQYLPLSFFVILPFVMEILPELKEKKWPIYILSIVIVISLLRINVAHTRYTYRLDWNRDFMNKNIREGRDKIILQDKDLHKETLMLTWAMAYEYWIMSTIENSKTVSVVAIKDEKQFDDVMDDTHVFLTMWLNAEYKFLDKRYFRFEDPNRLYKKYSMKEIDEGIVK